MFLVAKYLAEQVRRQGGRLILSPLAGVADMAAFATMRTGANFALQGLGTVTSPLMPELMRFLASRDQVRMESAFAFVWLVLCALLCPAMVVVQWIAPALFPMWTHGKILFDPWLFGMLSLSVALMGMAQPAAAVLEGNNILRLPLGITILAAVVALGGMFMLVPQIGIRGAALSLLTAELVRLVFFVWGAKQWLRGEGMHWPWKAFVSAGAIVPVTAIGMVGMELLPSGLRLVGLGLILIIQAGVAVLYWHQLPALVHNRAMGFIHRALRRI